MRRRNWTDRSQRAGNLVHTYKRRRFRDQQILGVSFSTTLRAVPGFTRLRAPSGISLGTALAGTPLALLEPAQNDRLDPLIQGLKRRRHGAAVGAIPDHRLARKN